MISGRATSSHRDPATRGQQPREAAGDSGRKDICERSLNDSPGGEIRGQIHDDDNDKDKDKDKDKD